MSASSSGSTRTTCGPGSSPATTNVPSSDSAEPGNQLSRGRVEREDVRADDASAVLRDSAGDAAGRAAERRRSRRCPRCPAMSSARRVRFSRPRRERDREHHRLGAQDAPAAADQLGLADHRVAEPVQVPDLVQRDRLEILPARLARGSDRPREGRVEEDVRLDDLPRNRVDSEGRRSEHAIEVGPVLETEHVDAVAGRGIRAGEAGELRRQRHVGDPGPRRERAIDRLLQPAAP